MSDYHILQQDKDQKGYTVAYHFPVPAGNNSAGKPWSTCVAEYKSTGGQSLTSQVPGLSQAEQNQVTAGTINEIVQFFRFSSIGLTPAQKKAEIDAAWAGIKTEKESELSVVLENWTRALNVA